MDFILVILCAQLLLQSCYKATQKCDRKQRHNSTFFNIHHNVTCCVFCDSDACDQGGRRVRVCVSTWHPSCSLAGCVVFVQKSCGVTSTGLQCHVCLVCTAAGGDATRGAALSRENVAATRSDQLPARDQLQSVTNHAIQMQKTHN